jgi:hypothetical protein
MLGGWSFSMNDKLNPVPGLLQISHEEAGFRKTVTSYIGGVLKSDAPQSIKVFIVIVLSLFVVISFGVLFVITHAICFKCGIGGPPPFTVYFSTLMGLSVGAIGPGIPLMVRMSSAEQSARLQMEFTEVAKKKTLRSKGPQIG